MTSRYSEKNKKRNQNRILNVLIAVVVGLILVFGYQLFFSSEPEAVETTAPGEKNTDTNKSEDNFEVEINDEVVENPEDSENSDELEEKTVDGGGPEGPWEPIGTEQEGAHTSSFEKGTVDWEEKIKALEYATGLSREEGMVIWWLGNGGGPEKARGVVSLPENRNTPYEVYLEWIENEGWKPISVKKINK
ncbi:YrrS family protein [Bacillus taeanensis]|uniref:DUF1510 domain-containing protein n=1 Tax=Bacillus taeanensis TaxID=273032 RepID=A0A366XX32_9BACI|nr:YrrS family protein [Bacillus taeanensis]RBW70457.1 hypothetical protein DS031_05365 [Bacillus taeanensis]